MFNAALFVLMLSNYILIFYGHKIIHSHTHRRISKIFIFIKCTWYFIYTNLKQ